MLSKSSSSNVSGLLAASVAAVGMAFMAPGAATAEDASIRPFEVHVSDEAIADMRLRLAQTRWPDMETVSDASQGAQLANLQELVAYWGDDYDWRKAEAQLNAYPQFVTTIDGVDM